MDGTGGATFSPHYPFMPRPETLPKDPRRRFSGMTHTGSRCAGLALVAGMALVLGACPQLLSDDFRVGTAASNGDGNRLDAATGSTGCSDGAQDDGETGVDCGGPCAPCGCTWSPFSTPEPVTVAGLPASSSLYGPALSADGSTLFFSSLSTGTQDVYSATRSDRVQSSEPRQTVHSRW